jgi:hypothetical protein
LTSVLAAAPECLAVRRRVAADPLLVAPHWPAGTDPRTAILSLLGVATG